jgi:hypothetical protein
VSGYTIDPNTGSLTPLPGNPLVLGVTIPSSIAAYQSSAGMGLYLTSPGFHGAGSISAVTLGASGATFTNIAGGPFPAQFGSTGGSFFSGGADPTFNQYYLETDASSSTLSVYLVNGSTGTLTPVVNGPFATGAVPDSVAGINFFVAAIETVFSHVYVANSGDGTISVYSMDTQSGALIQIGGSPFTVGSGLSAVATSVPGTCGCYVYASASQGVWGFSTDAAGGALTPLPNSPYAAGAGPGAIATFNNEVYVVNTVDETISAFTQGAGGALIPVGAAVKTGRVPSSIVIVARPNYN